MARAVGIDLGTTNSAVALCPQGSEPTIIANAEAGAPPSVVAFSRTAKCSSAGSPSAPSRHGTPTGPSAPSKRHMGTDWRRRGHRRQATTRPGDRARALMKLKAGRGATSVSPSPTRSSPSRPTSDDAQRQADQGGRRDRRPQRPAHRQRADRGGAGLRPRQGRGGRTHPPSSTSVAAPSTSPSSRSAQRPGDGFATIQVRSHQR